MVEAVMWIILMTTDGKTEMEYKVYYSSMQQCDREAMQYTRGDYIVTADGWKLKSARCVPFLKPLLGRESL